MNKNVIEEIKKHKDNISKEEIKNIEDFFEKFNKNCLINSEEKNKIKNDFINAIIFYINNNYSLNEILKLLDIKNIGTFYKENTITSFELDNYAKIISTLESSNYNNLFRISIHLNKEIIPELLQIALTFTIKRFPLFATKLKKNFFEYTLETYKKHYYIEKEDEYPCKPFNLKIKNLQLFRILYNKNKISLEMSHILTDGTGGIIFLKVLITEYLKLTEKNLIIEDDFYNNNQLIDNEEFENAFNKVPTNNIKSNFQNKKLLTINGKRIKNKPYEVVKFKLDTTKLKNIAKKYNTSITGYLTSAMIIANQSATNFKKGYTNVYIPINLRNHYKTKTIRNFSLMSNIYIKTENNLTLEEIVENVNKQLKEALLPNNIIQIIANANNLVSSSKYTPLIIKKLTAIITSKIIYNNYYTNNLSNLGIIKFSNNISNYIQSVDCYMNMRIVAKILCSVITFNDTTTFSIFKDIHDTKFEKALYEQFYKDNLILKK